MGRRLAEVYPSRSLVMGGATMLGLFAIVSIVLGGSDSRDDNLSVAAGVFAYAFIAFALIVGFFAWRGKELRAVHRQAEQFIDEHPTVRREIGEPVDVRMRPTRSERSEDGGQITMPALVAGPLGEGDASAVAIRIGEDWSIAGGSLTLGDDPLIRELTPV